MTEVIDAQGHWILVNEDCRHCGSPSKAMHPGGVVSQRWTCTRCGRSQIEGTSTAGNPDAQINDTREGGA